MLECKRCQYDEQQKTGAETMRDGYGLFSPQESNVASTAPPFHDFKPQ